MLLPSLTPRSLIAALPSSVSRINRSGSWLVRASISASTMGPVQNCSKSNPRRHDVGRATSNTEVEIKTCNRVLDVRAYFEAQPDR